MNRRQYSAKGAWHVTTEGDCEGKSTHDLGVHEGYLDDIAFALGRQAYYSLTFSAAKPLPDPVKTQPVREVCVKLDIDSGTWDLKSPERVAYFRNLLAGRDVAVTGSQFFASVILKRQPTKDEITPEAWRAAEKILGAGHPNLENAARTITEELARDREDD
jgi:hypothetical protein